MTDAFTPERIAQLREMLAKATPGLWKSAVDTWSAMALKRFIQSEFAGVAENLSIKNAEAIVAAVNTLPAALDEIERLQGRDKLFTAYVENTSGPLSFASICDRAAVAEAELVRVKAELDEAVGALKPFAVQDVDGIMSFEELDLDKSDFYASRSFLSRMEGRKDG